MSRILLPVNTVHSITVNNGTARTFTFNADGTLSVPAGISLGNGTAYKVILNPANIAGADKTFNFPNRTGNLALEDNTSLIAMLPSTAGNAGKVLGSADGGTTLAWISTGTTSLTSLNGISTATYPTQTFAIGTSGLAPAWVSQNNNTNTHTLNIPLAATASVTAGLFSNSDYVRIAFKDSSNTFTQPQTFSGTASTFAVPPQITTPGTGTNDVATYGQVLAAKAGLAARAPIAALDTVTTGTGLVTANPVIDGYTVQLNDRVLGTALTGGNAGKVYKATGSLSSVVWTLETDGQSGTGSPSDGDILFVKNGTDHHDQQWTYNGTAWILYSVAQAWTFSTGLNVSETTVTVSYGTSGTTACVGNDSRLSDSRTPLAHILDGPLHTISGKTGGQVLIATSPSTFGFITFSGDVSSITIAGVVTISKLGGTVLNDLSVQFNTATLTDNTTSNTLVTGASWSIATYRSIRMEYSISRGAGNYVVGTITLLHDGTTPRVTVTEDDSIGTHGVTFATDINSGNIRLLYQTTSTGTPATMRFTNKAFQV